MGPVVDSAVVDVAGSSAALVVGPGAPGGSADGTVTVIGGGTLNGNGTIIGTLFNAGTTGPGESPGTLVVDGDFEQSIGGLLAIEFGGLAPGSEFDVLDVSGAATLAGALSVSLIDGFSPAGGDSFVFLLASGGIIGQFDNIACANCGGITLQAIYGADFVSLNAVAAPVPVPAAGILLLGAVTVLAARSQRRATTVTSAT